MSNSNNFHIRPQQHSLATSLYDSAIQWPKITLITPSYNQGGYIGETIDSVLSQNYPNLEYIIMDAGSTDDTIEIIKKHQDKITYWESKKDRGQSHALNKGLTMATGDIWGYLNSDDCLLPDALYHVANTYLANKEVNNGDLILVGDCLQGISLNSPDNNIISHNCEVWTQNKIAGAYGIAAQPAVFWTKSDFYFNEDLDFCMDYDYWYKLSAAAFKAVRVPYTLAFYRLHDSSKSINLREKMWAEFSSLAIKWANDFTGANNKKNVMVAFNYKIRFYFMTVLNNPNLNWSKGATLKFMLFLLFNYPGAFFKFSFLRTFIKKLIKG